MTIEDVRGSNTVWVGPFKAEPARPKIEVDDDGDHWVVFENGRMVWGPATAFADRLGPYGDEPDTGQIVQTHDCIYWLVFEDSVPAWAVPAVTLGVFGGWNASRFANVMGAECSVRLESLKSRGLDAVTVDDFDRYHCAGRSRSSSAKGTVERSCGKLDDVRVMSAIEELEARKGVKVYHVAERVDDGESVFDCFFTSGDYTRWADEGQKLEDGRAHVYRIDPGSHGEALLHQVSFDVTDGCVVVRSAESATA